MAAIRLLAADNQASFVILYSCMFSVRELDANQSVVMATQHPTVINTGKKMGEMMRAVSAIIPGRECQVTPVGANP